MKFSFVSKFFKAFLIQWITSQCHLQINYFFAWSQLLLLTLFKVSPIHTTYLHIHQAFLILPSFFLIKRFLFHNLSYSIVGQFLVFEGRHILNVQPHNLRVFLFIVQAVKFGEICLNMDGALHWNTALQTSNPTGCVMLMLHSL